MSRKSKKSRKSRKVEVQLSERDRIENEVHSLLPDNRKVVRSEAKKLFEEDESDLITDRTPETPYNSDKELDEDVDLTTSNEVTLNHNDLLAALNMVESNTNIESNKEAKKSQSSYEPIDNATLQTAIPLIPFPPPTNGPPLSQKFSLGAVVAPPHGMSVQPSDFKSPLSSKTGDARSHTYSSSLEFNDFCFIFFNNFSQFEDGVNLSSLSEWINLFCLGYIDCIYGTLPLEYQSNISLNSETGSNTSGNLPSDDRKDTRTDRSENKSVTGIPSPAVSTTSLVSQTFSPMSSSPSTGSSSLVSQTMSPLKESTMKEDKKIISPSIPIIKMPHSIPSTTRSQTGSPIRSVNPKMPIDGNTSSTRSPIQFTPSPDTRQDIDPSSQTPVREKPQDFSRRSQRGQPIKNDSSLYQPSGIYNSKGEFFPQDQTLDDIPDIPSEKSERSPPMVTAKESMSSTSLSITSLPNRIYGDTDDEIGAKSDKQFVGRMTLKKNKKNEAGFEFEAKEPKEMKSKPRTPRKLKITNIFGGADRKYIPPVRRKKTDRSKQPTVSSHPPPLPDDSRAQLSTVVNTPKLHRNTDLLLAESLPLSVTKKSDRSIPSSSFNPTQISFLRTENSLLPSIPQSPSLTPSITHSPTPTTSPAAKSPVSIKKDKKIERTLLSPVANSPIQSKKKSKKRGGKKESIGRKNRKTEQKNTPQERVIYTRKPISPTIGTPKRKWQDVHKKKKEREDKSKKEREITKKSDKKSKERVEKNGSEKTNGPFYQQLVYSSYVTNGLNVSCYNYDEREEEKKKSPAIT
ncbi:hypothetical protein PRIPAC_73159 [Pristionchus pacificus]|nr:hypothetical protein PRIPAC_73159 [Pristionchus pacificus]